MNNEQLERIEKMLRAQLKSAGHVWWVSGFVYGQTARDDVFVILYPADEKLNEKVVRVYPHDFKKLPRYIPTDVDGGDTEANPNKEQARKKGIFHECPAFEIVTYDGKDTQMGKERRFGDVLRISRAGQQQPAPAQHQPRVSAYSSVIKGGDESPHYEHEHEREHERLPDYRAMALGAKTAAEFDYAAYMTLRNGMYTDQDRIAKTREALVPGWKAGERSNPAMLAALEAYREKRTAAEGRGEAPTAAHQFAKREAMGAYNKAIGQK